MIPVMIAFSLLILSAGCGQGVAEVKRSQPGEATEAEKHQPEESIEAEKHQPEEATEVEKLQTAEETRPEQSQLVEETYAEADTGLEPAQNIAPDHVQETTEGGSEIEEDARVSNPFFFSNDISQVEYKGSFAFDDFIDQDVKLNITELTRLRNGMLYELKLDPVPGIPEDRLSLGYFYVQADKIYKIEPSEENISRLKTSEELPEGSVIVCQDEEIKDTLGEDEPGSHHWLEANGEKREYRSYNNQAASGYYESFTWEKGKGLAGYRSGFGAERDSIDLQYKEDTW